MKRTALKRSTKPIRRKRSKPRRGREIDDDYKAFIAGFPCVACVAMSVQQKTRTEVAHVGERGSGQRSSDRETLPICERHHRTGPLAQHGKLGKHFWSHFGLDKQALIKHYQEMYIAQSGIAQ